MEYLTSIRIPRPNETFFGVPAGVFIRQGARVQIDGKVKARLHHVTDFKQFSGNVEQQSGYYFPFIVTEPGKKMELITNGKVQWTDVDFDPKIILRVKPGSTFELKVDGRTVARLDFSQARFDEPKGDSKMNVPFFDTGVCGINITGHIGTLNKDSKADEAAVVFDGALPIGARLVNLTVIPSADVEGGASVTVGDGVNKKAYADAAAITAGEVAVEDTKLKELTSGKVTVKLGAALTAGTVDIFATIIRLAV